MLPPLSPPPREWHRLREGDTRSGAASKGHYDVEPGIKTASGVNNDMPREPHSPPKSCVGSWGQRARHKGKASETRLQGRGFGQPGEKSGASAAAVFLSAFPKQQRNANPLRCAPGCWGGEMPSGTLCPGPAQAPQAQSSPGRDTLASAGNSRAFSSLWLSWKGVGFKRLILGDFIYRAKRKEIVRPDGARDAHGLGKCDLCKPPLTRVLIRPSAGKPGWRGLHKAVRFELGVLPEDLCHEGGHVSLFGVVQGKERVFLPTRSKTTSADTQGQISPRAVPGACHAVDKVLGERRTPTSSPGSHGCHPLA